MISKPHAQNTMNAEFGKVSYTIPDNHYIALSTSAITESTGLGFTEPSDANYERVTVANTSTNWTYDSTAGDIKNATAIEFPAFASTIADTTISHWFISEKATASTTGDKANYYDVIRDANGDATTFEIKAGGKISIPAGSLTLSRTNPTT
jgi:hypothetical protein